MKRNKKGISRAMQTRLDKRTLLLEVKNRKDGGIDEVLVNPEFFKLVKQEGEKHLCQQALAMQLRVRVYSFLPQKRRDSKNFQCGPDVRDVAYFHTCWDCDEYRETLFALWGKQALDKDRAKVKAETERTVASPAEIQKHKDGGYMSEEEMETRTNPNLGSFGEALLRGGLRKSRTRGIFGEECYRTDDGKRLT